MGQTKGYSHCPVAYLLRFQGIGRTSRYNTKYYHITGDNTSTSGSPVYNKACHTFKMVLFLIGQVFAKLNLD